MKKRLLYLLSSIVLCSLTACTEEELSGSGTLALSVRMGESVPAATRTLPTKDELDNSCIIRLRNGDNKLLREYEGTGSVPASMELVTGMYTVSATAGIKVDAAYDAPYYSGSKEFEIKRNETTAITLPVYVQNTVVTTAYTEEADRKFKSSRVTVSMSRGSLVFDKATPGLTGYYMLPKGESELDWKVEAVTVDGVPYTKTGILTGVQASTKYTLTFDYEELDPQDGGMGITIQVSEEPILEAWDVDISQAPRIERYENGAFHSLSDPVHFAIDDKGKDVNLFVLTTSELKSLTLSCPEFTTKVGLKSESIDVLTMADNVKETIEDKVSFLNYYDEATTNSIVKMTFKAAFFEAFAKKTDEEDKGGDYLVEIKATDANRKFRTAYLRILVSNAIVTTELVDDYDVWAHKATVEANVNQVAYEEAASKELGFEYRVAGSDDAWSKADAAIMEDNESRMSAVINGLTPGTTYEYRAWCSGQDSESQTYTFTTERDIQLKNSGFEDWSKPGSPWLLYGSGDEMYWDSGNWGATTLSDKASVTTPDESITAPGSSGTRSIKMQSAFVGVGSIGKFAAGNAFVGRYIKTNGTSGAQIGFGRPHAARPNKLKGYAKYTPATIGYSEVDEVSKGEMDSGHIYVALGDWPAEATGDSNVPFLVDTSAKKFFDKTGPNVIAFGEIIFSEATEGEGMVPFEIELRYKDTRRKAKYIMVVATSSRYGDYFTGGTGSTLWLDDLELIYNNE